MAVAERNFFAFENRPPPQLFQEKGDIPFPAVIPKFLRPG
jgi:hypothetical protein